MRRFWQAIPFAFRNTPAKSVVFAGETFAGRTRAPDPFPIFVCIGSLRGVMRPGEGRRIDSGRPSHWCGSALSAGYRS